VRSRTGVIGLVLLMVSAAPASASDDFEAALKTACAEGSALTDARLLDIARATYRSLDRTAPGFFCESEAVDGRLDAVRSAQRRRARAIEVARVYGLAARQRAGQVRERTLERWREHAYEQYVAGLTIDPVAAGARAGLRRLLKEPLRGDHCERARELLDTRLLWEARAEIARGMSTPSAAACRSVRQALVKRRARAFDHVHQGLAAERAGNAAGARAEFIAALAADPGAHGALAGLRRVPSPLPTDAAQPSVVTRLEIGGDCARGKPSGPRPALVSVATVRVASGDPDVERMRENRARGARFRAARDSLLYRVGLPRPDDETLIHHGYNAQDRAGSVELAVADGVATVTFRVDGAINERRPQYVWPWVISPDDEGVIVEPGLGPAPPGTKRRAELASCGWKAAGSDPQPGSDSAPTHGDRSTLAWDLRGVEKPPRVTLATPRLDRLSLGGSSAWALLRSMGALLVPGALFTFALVLLRGARRWRLRSAAAIGLVTVLADGAGLYMLYQRELEGTGRQLAYAVVPLVLALALFLVLAAPRAIAWRVLWGLAIVAALALVVWSAMDTPWFDLPGDVVLALAVGLVALMSYALLSAAASGLALGVGRPRSEWKTIWRRSAHALIWIAVLAQAGQPVLRWQTGWPDRAVIFEGDNPVREHWRETLHFDVIYEPFATLGTSVLLLVVPAAGLAIAALEVRRARQPRRATFATWHLRWSVGLLFAIVALGTSAPVLGLPIPIAFALSLLYLKWTRSKAVDRAETYARKKLARSETADSVLTERRRELVERAAAVRRQLRVEDDLQAKYAAGDDKVTDPELATRVQAAQDRTRKLREGDATEPPPPPVTVPLPEKSPPEVVALALGPTGDWGANGRAAVRLALPLIAIPVAFSAYVIVDNIVDRWSLAVLYHAPIAIIGSLAAETLFWIVAAFTLGALLAYLPFRSSPAKGVALAGAYIVPLLALHVISEVVDDVTHFGRLFHLQLSSWTFRGFELLLFLVALGVRLDRVSVKDTVARLVPLYGLDDFRATVVYAAPVVLTIVLVGGQLFRGEAAGAIQTILENVSSFVPAGARLPGLGN
jgi:hypothetical protein